MQQNPNIKLDEVLAETYVQVLADDRVEVGRKIRGIINDLRSGLGEVEKAKKALAKAEEKVGKLNDKIAKIKAGDWSVLGKDEGDF